jgi:alpha-mannosidase
VYALRAEPGPFDAGAASRFGAEFSSPPLAREVELPFGPASGPLKESSGAFLRLQPANVRWLTLKRAESGEPDTYIFRFQEVAGRTASAVCHTSFPLEAAVAVDLREEPVGTEALAVNPLRVALKPWQVVSVRARVRR